MDLQDAIDSIRRYVDHGIPTGGFLRAVLANDLMQAVGRADESSLANLAEIARYIYNDIPANAHGSYEKVDEYSAAKRDANSHERVMGKVG
jgi:hypothetical protein